MVGVGVAIVVLVLLVALLAVPKLLRHRPSPAERLRRKGIDDRGGEPGP